jgi:hypothetical protein
VRSTGDSIASIDAGIRVVTFGRSIADSAVAVESSHQSIHLSKSATDTGQAADSNVRITSRSRVTADRAILLDSVTRGGLTAARSSPDHANAEDVTTRSLSFSRVASSDSVSETEIINRVGLLIESTDPAIALDTIHRTSSTTRAGTETTTTSDSNAHTLTRGRITSDASRTTDTIAEATVIYCMGQLIWVVGEINSLQNHPQFTKVEYLPSEPINNLRVFEGRLFPRYNKGGVFPSLISYPSSTLYPSGGEPDVFSFQLTSYPWSVNKPRQTTNINQGLEPFPNPFAAGSA